MLAFAGARVARRGGHGHEPYTPVFTAGSARRKELDELLSRYPTKMAALLPALWMVQHERGWVSDDGMAEVAAGARAHAGVREGRRDVLHDVPPASGREALHPGVHDVAVQRLRRRRRRRRVPQAHGLPGARADVARRQVHGDRSRVPRRVRLRDADHDQRGFHRVGHAGDGAARFSRDSSNAWDIRTSHTSARPRCSPSTSASTEATTLDGWKKRGGYAALREGARHGAGRHRRRRQGLRAARPRRRRLPDGHQVVVHEAGRRQAALPLLQRRRVRAGHVQGSRDHALDAARPRRRVRDRRVRDRRRDVLHLHSRRVHRAASRAVEAALKERTPPASSARTRWAPARRSTSTCTAAPARTSAAKRRR